MVIGDAKGPYYRLKIIAIDPGRSKCGLAVVSAQGVILQEIVPTTRLVRRVEELLRTDHIIVIGSGTGLKTIREQLKRHFSDTVPIMVVSEENTTLEARKRYWQQEGRRGWRRLFPASLQLPPRPVDDYAAVVLAERYLRRRQDFTQR